MLLLLQYVENAVDDWGLQGLAAARYWQHGQKKHRYGMDNWDMVSGVGGGVVGVG